MKKQIADVEVQNKISKLNAALAAYTDDEKDMAKEEIKQFEADPMKYEINSITDKILQEIGKKAKEKQKQEAEKRIAEQNSLNGLDIFAGLDQPKEQKPLENLDDIF